MIARSLPVAIVTGAASRDGIGFAIAECLARSGSRVLLTDLNEEAVASRAAELRAAGFEVDACAHDVTCERDWQKVFDNAATAWGGVDHLVNNAGTLRMARVGTISRDEWDMTLSTNLTSCLIGIQASVPYLRARGGAAIVNMCSVSGIVGTPNCGAYTASKGGLRAFTKTAAIDLAPLSIRVNSVHPGFVATAMQDDAAAGLGQDAYDAAVNSVPLKRFGMPGDVAGAVAFLLSDQAAYITGAELVIDGGLSCSI